MASKSTPGKNHTRHIEIQLFLAVRKALGFTQEEMAAMLGVTARQYGRVERGEVKTPQKTLHLVSMMALMRVPGARVKIPPAASQEVSEWE